MIVSASDLIIQKNQYPAEKPKSFDDIQFGAVFSDHMLEIDWSLDNGWEKPVIKPFQNLSLVNISLVHNGYNTRVYKYYFC